ncbi:efflux transporter outer membrane subunit [Granulicella mallensis]|uniref:RND efflux system, outer membrane lipoprotein, NodT family n=1 Tax=Granulicella mallensis (strain ATCC BAA-1857 / DSM 23137 / MP5ACTX8) TaxID=682795 RepID=G8P0R6_GRAMM|nr:efflux transporter outer membrane subunit [Granulicella mallensis]AEU34674.1 RND efflux system, outer membrane lipoprotein, NodT family [Granulicella mallensis MP5ACTX8]
MRTHSLPTAAALIATLALSGCKVGPNYKAPAMPAPPAYSDNGHNGNWTTATPADGTLRGDWWTVYQDSTLNDFEQRCAKSNQTIEAALHSYEQAHDIVRENRAALFPTVSIGASATRNLISDTKPLHVPGEATNYWDFLIPLSISWEPDFWGAIRRQIESSAANAQASAADLANTRLSLQGMLAVSYVQLRGVDLQAQLLRSTLDSFQQTLQLTKDRLKGGLASQSDVEQAQTQLEQTQAQLIDLGVQRAQLEHAIAVLVGEAATNFHIEEKPLAGDPPSVPTGIPSELLQRRPDIASAERHVASANALIGVAKAAYYPSIVLGASGGVETDKIGQLFNSSSAMWNAGPGINETIYDAGRRKAQVDFAIAQRAQATALYREQVLSAFRDVEDQLSALRVLEQEATVTDRAVASAKRSTELSTMRYKRGLATYLEVLTAQTIELANERTAASLVTQRIVASAQLQLALGGGWDAAQLPKN